MNFIYGIKGIGFKQYENMLKKFKKQFAEGTRSFGGEMDHRTEKEFKIIAKTFNKHILNSKDPEIYKMVEKLKKTNGNIKKLDPKVKKTVDFYYKKIKAIQKEFKNNKNISENNVLKAFTDMYEFLNDSKYTKVFEVAFKEFNKINTKNNAMSTIAFLYILYLTIFCLVAIAMLFVLVFIIVQLFKDLFGSDEYIKENPKLFEDQILRVTGRYSGFVTAVVYNAIGAMEMLKSSKDPSKDLKEAMALQKNIKNGLNKGREDFYIDQIYNKKDALISKYKRGEEGAILVIAAVIAGFIALFSGIRMAVYYIGKTKVDIIAYITIESEMLTVNIYELKEKYDNALARGDKNEAKKLEKIIKKQEKWLDRFDAFTSKGQTADAQAASSAEEQYKSDEEELENPNSYDEQPEIIL